MAEKTHVPFSEYKEDILKIKELTANLKEVVENMKCTVSMKGAYENSVKNLEKKNEKYGVEKLSSLNDEDKEFLRRLHAGEIEVREVSAKPEAVSANKKKHGQN